MAISHSVSRMVYPIDLESYPNNVNPYGSSYVQFNINVHKDSKLIAQGSSVPTADIPIKPREAGEITGLEISAAVPYTAVTTGGAVLGATLGKSVSSAPIALPVGALGGAVIGAAAADLIGSSTGPYKQLQATIALHIPIDLSIKYHAEWKDVDTMLMAAGAQALEGLIGGSKVATQAGTVEMVSGVGANVMLSKSPIADITSKISGLAANPKKELLFKNMDFRTFTFTYDFHSRSPSETQSIHEIIKTFKYHMHPEFKQGSANFLYIYPSEFEVTYFLGSKQNEYIHKHTSCVLTDMDIKYTPHGQFVSHTDGSPVTIRVVLTFKELAILTKDKIEEGY